jgi:hypothetical protein
MDSIADPRLSTQTFVKGVHGVRYQVKDVSRSVAFYTGHLLSVPLKLRAHAR